MDCCNNTIFITGGSAGIGLALARSLYSLEGNQIIICGRNREKLQQVQREMPNLEIVRCDISEPDEVDRCVETLASKFPNLNVLINNAAVIHTYNFLGDHQAFQLLTKEVQTNILGPMHLTHALLP